MQSDHETHTLRIYEAFLEDEGLYRCCIGKASTSARLHVLSDAAEKPKVTQLKDNQVEQGSPLRLNCSVSGSPNPKISWYKDSFPITPSRETEVCSISMLLTHSPHSLLQIIQNKNECILVIKRIFPEDQGVYKCVAENCMGKHETECRVTVTSESTIIIDSI